MTQTGPQYVTQATSTDNESKTSIWTVGNLVTECYVFRIELPQLVLFLFLWFSWNLRAKEQFEEAAQTPWLSRKARRPKQWNWIDCFGLTVGSTKTEAIYPALRHFQQAFDLNTDKREPRHTSRRKVCTQNRIQSESGPS